MTPAELAVLLNRLAPHLDELMEPWAVIGSAALIVSGAPWPQCADLDILTTEVGAETLERHWADWRQGHYAPDPKGPFRSRFSRYDFSPGAVEVMGGLRVRKAGAWKPVRVRELTRFEFEGRQWPTPSHADQLRILKLFGRDKDLEKAALIERLALGG
jgi:hypothetical protein